MLIQPTHLTLKPSLKEELVESIFTKYPKPGLSSKYVFIPTNIIISDLEKLGWIPFKSQEIKVKKVENRGFQKHGIHFYNENIFTIEEKEQNKIYPTLLVMNSHNGGSSFQFRVGLYRLVCLNGLVISEAEFSKIKIPHIGYSFQELKITINQILEKLPSITDKINIFKTKQLSSSQIEKFTKQLFYVRFKPEQTTPFHNLIPSEREEDKGSSLWVVFNRITEKILRGGFQVENTNKETIRKASPVKSFIKQVEYNQKFWELAESYT